MGAALGSGILSAILGIVANVLQGVILGLISQARTRADNIALGDAREATAQAEAGARVDRAVADVAARRDTLDDLAKALNEGTG